MNKAITLPAEIQEAMNRELLPKNQIKVPKTLSDPHPVITAWAKQDEEWVNRYKQFGWASDKKETPLEHRRKKIISTFLKALEKRGFKAEADRNYGNFVWILNGPDKIGFTLEEHFHQYRREVTKEEKKNWYYSNQKWRQIKEATGKFVLKFAMEPKRGFITKFIESDDFPFEATLNTVTAAVIEHLWRTKKVRLERAAEEQKYWERQQEKLRLEELLKQEQSRKIELQTKVSDWKKAKDIQDYVKAVEEAYSNKGFVAEDNIFSAWKEWALAYATELDAIQQGNPLVKLTTETMDEDEFEWVNDRVSAKNR